MNLVECYPFILAYPRIRDGRKMKNKKRRSYWEHYWEGLEIGTRLRVSSTEDPEFEIPVICQTPG